MKRLMKKAYSNQLFFVDGIKFEYTLDGGTCCLCNEKIFSDDGAYYATKNDKKTYICTNCVDQIKSESNDEDIENLMK